MAAFLKHSFFLEFSPRALSLYDGSMIVQNSSSRQKVSISDSDLDGLKKKTRRKPSRLDKYFVFRRVLQSVATASNVLSVNSRAGQHLLVGCN